MMPAMMVEMKIGKGCSTRTPFVAIMMRGMSMGRYMNMKTISHANTFNKGGG